MTTLTISLMLIVLVLLSRPVPAEARPSEYADPGRMGGGPVAASPGCDDGPAPATPSGYAALWSRLPLSEWGAADLALSVRMGPRRVWLYGDTMSARENGFVHSSAITQDRACLHVSDGGAQLLPDVDRTHIFWIHDAWRVEPTRPLIRIQARAIELTGRGPWAFRDGGYFRRATVRLEESGDVTFLRWGRTTYTPEPDMGRLIIFGPGHFGYSVQRHGRLPNGRRLVTTSQNWDDGHWHGWKNYRPIFSSE